MHERGGDSASIDVNDINIEHQINAIRVELERAKKILDEIKPHYREASSSVDSLEHQLKVAIAEREAKARADAAALQQKAEEPRVSDHAVVRYLERVYGFDFESIRNELMTDTVRMACKSGAAAVKFGEYKLQISNGVVTTCIVGGRKKSVPKNRRRRDYQGDSDVD